MNTPNMTEKRRTKLYRLASRLDTELLKNNPNVNDFFDDAESVIKVTLQILLNEKGLSNHSECTGYGRLACAIRFIRDCLGGSI